jgi:hypothetical protein
MIKRFFSIKRISISEQAIHLEDIDVKRLLELKQRYNQLMVELLELDYEIFGLELVAVGRAQKGY